MENIFDWCLMFLMVVNAGALLYISFDIFTVRKEKPKNRVISPIENDLPTTRVNKVCCSRRAPQVNDDEKAYERENG